MRDSTQELNKKIIEIDDFLEELTFREMQLEEWKRKELQMLEEEFGVEVIL